jgi:hypothetical protein
VAEVVEELHVSAVQVGVAVVLLLVAVVLYGLQRLLVLAVQVVEAADLCVVRVLMLSFLATQ